LREGSALLQGIVTCGHCGRRLRIHYRGRNSTPGYHCSGKNLVEGRGVYCLNVGGLAIEQTVANAFLQAVTPAAVDAMRLTVEQLQTTTTPLWRNGAWKWSGRVTKPSGPSVAIEP
jgi:Recombinase zinc beta ribbon domain